MLRISLLLGMICVVAAPLSARAQGKRVKPKPFDREKINDVFFPDVFSVLVGSRPAAGGAKPVAKPLVNADAAPAAAAPPAGQGWSRWISATTLENEIKMIKADVDREVTSVSQFRGRGHMECRRLFSVAAVVFAVIAEYDQKVRWNSDAAGIRDVFARTAFNCKTGDKRVYDQSKLRKGDLQELLGGQTPPLDPGEPVADWAAVADRGPLMQRLKIGFDDRLKPLLSSKSEMGANASDIRHEAEMIAMLSDVLTRAEMEDSSDETYAQFAHNMRNAANTIVSALESKDYDQASQAAGEIAKACSDCHDGYR